MLIYVYKVLIKVFQKNWNKKNKKNNCIDMHMDIIRLISHEKIERERVRDNKNKKIQI